MASLALLLAEQLFYIVLQMASRICHGNSVLRKAFFLHKVIFRCIYAYAYTHTHTHISPCMSLMYLQMRIAIGITKIICDFLLWEFFWMTKPWMQNQTYTDYVYIHENKIVLKINATVVFPTEFIMTELHRGIFLSRLYQDSDLAFAICFQIQ